MSEQSELFKTCNNQIRKNIGRLDDLETGDIYGIFKYRWQMLVL